MAKQVGNRFPIVSSPDGFCKDHGDVDHLEKHEKHQVSIMQIEMTGQFADTDEYPNDSPSS